MSRRDGEPASVAVIVGGGRGMGAGIARKLGARGCRLALTSSSSSAKALAFELGGFGLVGSAVNAD